MAQSKRGAVKMETIDTVKIDNMVDIVKMATIDKDKHGTPKTQLKIGLHRQSQKGHHRHSQE